jgi:hypothetical protein
VKIGRLIEVGVAHLNERCGGGFVTSENDEQHCGVVVWASLS